QVGLHGWVLSQRSGIIRNVAEHATGTVKRDFALFPVLTAYLSVTDIHVAYQHRINLYRLFQLKEQLVRRFPDLVRLLFRIAQVIGYRYRSAVNMQATCMNFLAVH